MFSVTSRIKRIKQIYGGYLPKNLLTKIEFDDDKRLNDNEDYDATIIGLVVDYMTRFIISKNKIKSFAISLLGAKRAEELCNKKNAMLKASKYLNGINGLDDDSIINACKLVRYDVFMRNIFDALKTNDEYPIPNKETIDNIKIMVERSIDFLADHGPIISQGFTFENGGYSKTVSTGDGDYLMKDGIWDFKVSTREPQSKDTLQILMYYIMATHSSNDIFNKIKRIGIFNPRLNVSYYINVEDIPKDVIREVEKDVICY